MSRSNKTAVTARLFLTRVNLKHILYRKHIESYNWCQFLVRTAIYIVLKAILIVISMPIVSQVVIQ